MKVCSSPSKKLKTNKANQNHQMSKKRTLQESVQYRILLIIINVVVTMLPLEDTTFPGYIILEGLSGSGIGENN